MILESVAAAVLIAGANYADYATTMPALKRGGTELNFLAGSNGERVVPVKMAATVAEVVAFEVLRKRHKKTAWAFVASVVAVNLVIAHHNHGVLREKKP